MKKIKYVFLVMIQVLFAVTLISCSNGKKNKRVEFANDVDVYYSGMSVASGFVFDCESIEETVLLDNTLVEEFTLKIYNYESHSYSFQVSDFKLMANEKELSYPIYSEYNYETKDGSLIENQIFKLDKGESKELNFIFSIKEGNSDCFFNICFKLGDVNCNLHFYDKNDTVKFEYVHNPMYNSNVVANATKDSNAYFGYVPSATGNLKDYASYDWTKEDDVLGYKENRIEYHTNNNVNIKALELKLRAENKTIEEIARACSAVRNENRLAAYKDNPEGMESAKKRNLELYGNELGPTPESLFEKYESWEKVLEKSYSINAAMDACCGLYDDYFEYYYS